MSYSRYSMLQKFVNGIPQQSFKQGELLPYSPFDTFDDCNEDNASPDITPDNPSLTYRWIVSSEPWCEGTNEFKTEKQQQSADSGQTWIDSGATRKGEFVKSNSYSCGYIAERWVNISGDFVCENGDKYTKQKKQTSTDGVTWIDSGDTRKGSLIEVDSADCGYPQYRWVEIPLDVDYVCVGEDKYYKEKEQITQDGITWTDTGRTRRGRGAEVHSADCGYIPPSYITRWVDVQGEYVCQGTNKYQKQKEQISNDSGQTWQDTGNVRAGSLIQSQSYDCGYVSYRWVTDQSNYVCQGNDKYAQEIEESTTDGEVWTPTGRTRTGALIERDSFDCDYVSYRWVTVSGEYVCSGTDKYTKEKEQSTTDGSVWVDTGRERAGSLIESQSYSCGYVSYRWVTVPNTPWCDGYDLYTTEKQQYTTDGTNWQDVTPLNTRKGALVERNSETCGYVPPTPTDGYLTFTVPANSPNSSIRFSNPLEYSLNGGAWTSLAANTNSPSIGEGDTLKVRANLMPSTTSGGIGTFSSTGRFNASGYPDSLIFGDNYGQTDLTGYDYTFYALFKDCTYLNDASGLLLSATTLANGCYFSMFENCTSLSTTPTLPAMILAVDCYNSMFFGCTSLTTAPALPATTLALDCYNSMFFGCTSLVSVPSNLLPATALTEGCYRFMFCDCSSLVVAPDLSSATALPRMCYEGMFENCVSLNYIKMMATDVSAYYCLNNWVNGVQTNSGTFVKSPCVQIPRGISGIPNNWTVVEEGSSTQERWVDSPDYQTSCGELFHSYICENGSEYQQQKKQISTDCGSTWTDSSPLETRAGSLIKTNSSVCLAATVTVLTLTSNGYFYLRFLANYLGANCQEIGYKINNGNWIFPEFYVEDDFEHEYTSNVPINQGDVIQFKGREGCNIRFSSGTTVSSNIIDSDWTVNIES